MPCTILSIPASTWFTQRARLLSHLLQFTRQLAHICVNLRHLAPTRTAPSCIQGSDSSGLLVRPDLKSVCGAGKTTQLRRLDMTFIWPFESLLAPKLPLLCKTSLSYWLLLAPSWCRIRIFQVIGTTITIVPDQYQRVQNPRRKSVL